MELRNEFMYDIAQNLIELNKTSNEIGCIQLRK